MCMFIYQSITSNIRVAEIVLSLKEVVSVDKGHPTHAIPVYFPFLLYFSLYAQIFILG